MDRKAVAGPRSEFEGVLGREESEKSGVYFLTGTDPESGRPAIYVGEAESIKDRVKSHLDKDFWNHVVYFVSKDENLTKAHIRYLEGKLIEKARRWSRLGDKWSNQRSEASGVRPRRHGDIP